MTKIETVGARNVEPFMQDTKHPTQWRYFGHMHGVSGSCETGPPLPREPHFPECDVVVEFRGPDQQPFILRYKYIPILPFPSVLSSIHPSILPSILPSQRSANHSTNSSYKPLNKKCISTPHPPSSPSSPSSLPSSSTPTQRQLTQPPPTQRSTNAAR